MQRGVSSCEGGGWERLNDPRLIGIRDFKVARAERQVKITLGGYAKRVPTVTQRVEHWLTAENL
jgi:prepilin peptidase dependent protein B